MNFCFRSNNIFSRSISAFFLACLARIARCMTASFSCWSLYARCWLLILLNPCINFAARFILFILLNSSLHLISAAPSETSVCFVLFCFVWFSIWLLYIRAASEASRERSEPVTPHSSCVQLAARLARQLHNTLVVTSSLQGLLASCAAQHSSCD